MATAINTSVTWEGIESMEYFISPMFIGKSPLETQGIRVMPNITSGQNLNFFSSVKKILKKYVKGFSATEGSTYTQRTITTHRLKAEMADDGIDFYNTVFEQGLRKDDWNNLEDTALKEIILKLYQDAVSSDIYRQAWLSDSNKETLTSCVYDGDADVDYNVFDGFWKLLYDNSSTTIGTSDIYRYEITNGTTAQVATITLSGGSSSNLIVSFAGVDYTTAYATGYDETAAAFVLAHAAAFLLRDIVLTSGTATIVLTSSKAGQPFAAPTIAATSTITGSVAATTANVAPEALSSGESEDIFLKLYQNCNKVLKQVPKNEKVFLVSDTVYENYETYLESLGTERSQKILEDGTTALTYRGIPILSMGWDVFLDADFPHASGELPWGAHRVIYTNMDNLVLGIDSKNQFNETKMWYNPDEEENRFRQKLVMGTQYVHESLTAIAL